MGQHGAVIRHHACPTDLNRPQHEEQELWLTCTKGSSSGNVDQFVILDRWATE